MLPGVQSAGSFRRYVVLLMSQEWPERLAEPFEILLAAQDYSTPCNAVTLHVKKAKAAMFGNPQNNVSVKGCPLHTVLSLDKPVVSSKACLQGGASAMMGGSFLRHDSRSKTSKDRQPPPLDPLSVFQVQLTTKVSSHRPGVPGGILSAKRFPG